MSQIRIIGGGIAGMATAIKIALYDQTSAVVIHEKKCPESNTQIAGMRVRLHKPGKGQQPVEELTELLQSRNNGVSTPEMEEFAQLIQQEVQFWENAHSNPLFTKRGVTIPKLPSEYKSEWFGPQWGTGRGKGYTALSWFRELARQIGVKFEVGEVVHLDRVDDRIAAIQVKKDSGELVHAHADMFILAGGSVAGTLYHSTNKEIHMSPQRLAFDAGIPLTGATINMWHPFGRTDGVGNAKVGCFETDAIDNVVVEYLNGSVDEATTAYLKSHKAHDNFPEICRRLIEHGYRVQLVHEDGRRECARLSHHYAHLGIQTLDGVSVLGMSNMFAAGDAADWNRTNYTQRFPGFGIAKAIVDAELVRSAVSRISDKHTKEGGYSEAEHATKPFQGELQRASQGKTLKDINTTHALELEFGGHTPEKSQILINSWASALSELSLQNTNVALSEEVKNAYELRYVHNASEPISIISPTNETRMYEPSSMGMRK